MRTKPEKESCFSPDLPVRRAFNPLQAIIGRHKRDMVSLTGFTPLETIGRHKRAMVSLTGFTPLETIGRQKRAMVSLTGFTLVEVLIAVGIFGSIMGATLILLNTAKNSVNISEAQLQSKEYTQMALERIVSEIRLSRPDKVCISNTIRWASEASPSGGVLNFQLPVGIYETLNLTDNSGLKWGSAATEGYFVAYYVSDSRLLRGAYSETDGSDVVPQVIAPHISSVTFSRDTPSSDLIHIEITAESESLYGDVAQVQGADIKLRN